MHCNIFYLMWGGVSESKCLGIITILKVLNSLKQFILLLLLYYSNSFKAAMLTSLRESWLKKKPLLEAIQWPCPSEAGLACLAVCPPHAWLQPEAAVISHRRMCSLCPEPGPLSLAWAPKVTNLVLSPQELTQCPQGAMSQPLGAHCPILSAVSFSPIGTDLPSQCG